MAKALPDSLTAQIDPDRMAQLFTNLISNARHHGTAGEAVRMTLALQVREVGPSGRMRADVAALEARTKIGLLIRAGIRCIPVGSKCLAWRVAAVAPRAHAVQAMSP